jgi:phosphoglycerate dehydrogenase-like enzyme
MAAVRPVSSLWRGGSRLCEILVALGMKVLVCDPFKKVDRRHDPGRPGHPAARGRLRAALAVANEKTENLIGAREFA